MLKHHKIKDDIVKNEVNSIINTIKPSIVAKSSEIIGEYSATDMVEFSDVPKSRIRRIYVKYRDGLSYAIGFKKVIRDVDIRYIHTERSGTANEQVSVKFWDPLEQMSLASHKDEVVWFADPINARGTTVLGTMDFLRKYVGYDTILLSHILANKVGINKVQTKITDYSIKGFMNYAFYSSHLDTKTGYLNDGLKFIPDYGDKLFGTLGADYPEIQLQQVIKDLIDTQTQAGREEVIRGIILYLLQLRWNEEYSSKRDLQSPTRLWINMALFWYVKIKKLSYIKLEDLAEKNVFSVLDNMEKTGFIDSITFPMGNSFIKYYKPTEEGLSQATKVYNPVLGSRNILLMLNKEFGTIIKLSPKAIRNYLDNN